MNEDTTYLIMPHDSLLTDTGRAHRVTICE